MLNPAYDELRHIQRQISKSQSLAEVRAILEKENADLEVEISSYSVWTLKWSVCANTFTGVFNVQLTPSLTKDTLTLETHAQTLRLETADSLAPNRLEEMLIKTLWPNT